VKVRVRDNGIGMDSDALAHIFEPFTRIAPSLDRGDRGLGIGLTLSLALVELHGGRLTAHSAGPGRGSEFTVSLPVGDAPAAPAPAPLPPLRSANGGRGRLLLVEDEIDVAEMTRERLLALGRDVRVARDGVEAVEIAMAFRPELLLVDLGLPGMSGYDVARRLRKEGALNGAVFVALTGYGDESARRRSLEAGFDRHLTKPISEEALRQLLGAA
jgi:CheY-like chemotaxis protein